MTNITSYFQNGKYYYQYDNGFASGAIDISGMSGIVMISYASDASGISGASNASGVSGLSGASGVSGASNVFIGTVDKLSISQVIELFTTGNLTVAEFQKWCQSKNISYSVSDNGTLTTISFKYLNKQYSITCNNVGYISFNII